MQGPKLSLAGRLKAQEQKKVIFLLRQPSEILSERKEHIHPKVFRFTPYDD